jgi:NAD+ synthase (glutamine-hydrolysing)
MKIALAQINPIVGNIKYNVEKIIGFIKSSKIENVDLVIFPELAICGYPPHDLLTYDAFVETCEKAIFEDILPHTSDIGIVIGSPSKNTNTKGKSLYNSAFFIQNNKIEQIYHKINLPDYDVFDEYRYFESGTEKSIIEIKNKKYLLTICEDLWGANNLYPNDIYQTKKTFEGIDGIINIAASPFNKFQKDIRKNHLQKIAKENNCPIFYTNTVGANTDLVFDGGSKVYDNEGNVILQAQFFEEDLLFFDTENKLELNIEGKEHFENIHNALVLGIKDFFDKQGFKKAILGLSGGVDSALTLYLAVQALGAENVLSVLLPSHFSSQHSIDDSIALVNNLKSKHEIISIEDIYKSFNESLLPIFNNLPFNVAEENIQARSRGVLLMAISNKLGYILLNTTNKSEMAVGYGTLYGDMCGSLSVLGDVYKTEVFSLCKWINRNQEIIPNNIITKAPSAELRPDQKDSDSLPEYDVLDKILTEFIENKKTASEIIKLGFETETVEKTLRLVNANEYKRFQAAPVIRISTKAFGAGRKMPLVGDLSVLRNI